MTDLILYSKPFDWNDNLSEEAIESFESIRDDLPYCTCQSIGMALAKLELLEKQGCKVIDSSVSSSEKQKPKSEWEHDHEILKAYSDGANAVLDKVRAEIEERKLNSGGEPNRELAFNVCLQIIDKYAEEGEE